VLGTRRNKPETVFLVLSRFSLAKVGPFALIELKTVNDASYTGFAASYSQG